MDDLNNVTLAALWRRIRTGSCRESTAAADELERRLPALAAANPVAKQCVERAHCIDRFLHGETYRTLMDAAAEINRLHAGHSQSWLSGQDIDLLDSACRAFRCQPYGTSSNQWFAERLADLSGRIALTLGPAKKASE